MPKAAAAPPPEGGFKTFDRYVAEAQVAPFVLPITDDEQMVVPCPSGDNLRLLDRAFHIDSLEMMVAATFGDQAERLWELAGPQAFPVVRAVLSDALDHFGLGKLSLPE